MPNFFLTLVLALITMVGPLGIDTYLPSFPAIAQDFAVSPLAVQQTLSLYIGGMAVMMLFYGTLSDSFGRKRVMLVSLVVFIATSVAAAFAPSIGMLIVIRLLQGMAGGAGMVIARAMVQDRFTGHDAQRMMALILMVFGIAPAVAPLIGGWLETTWGWRSVFWFLALFGVALLLAGRWVLPETLAVADRAPFRLVPIARSYGQALGRPRFMLMCLAIALTFAGLPLYVGSAAAYVMGILHQPATAFGWLFWPLVGGLVSGSALASKIGHRFSLGRLVGVGFGMMGLALAWSVAYTSLFTAAVPWAVFPFALYTFGLAIASPGMTVMTLDEFPELRGLGAALQGFVQMMVFSLVAGLLSPLLFDSARHLALGHAAMVLSGIGVWGAAVMWLPSAHAAKPASPDRQPA